MMEYNPVIVVVAYNRSDSLLRLLKSLSQAKEISGAKLIISIDNQEPHNLDVKKVAEEYNWPFGEKEVRYQSEHLGLKRHIIQCGDLAFEYGSVIILEDDLVVSPYFYSYAKAAAEFYSKDEQIGGISLYNQPRQEAVYLPFAPLADTSDVYFMQFPSSLGQLWTRDQWSGFKSWFDAGKDLSMIPIPGHILNWPETSWKKHYAAYIMDQDKYFVYPRVSLTTNFFDGGTHLAGVNSHGGQTQLNLFKFDYRFTMLSDSNCIYDMNLELRADCVKNLSFEVSELDFELDLYGSKEMSRVRAPYVITSRPCKNPIKSYRRALKPHEMNIIFDLGGQDLSLCKKEDVIIAPSNSQEQLSEFTYFYTSYNKGTKFLVYRYLRKRKWLQQFFK